MRPVVALVTIEALAILIGLKDDFWILPGGKPDEGENDSTCLRRELSEELPNLTLGEIFLFGEFIGVAPRRGDTIRVIVYQGFITGDITPRLGDSFREARWATYQECQELNLSDVTKQIVENLRERGYL